MTTIGGGILTLQKPSVCQSGRWLSYGSKRHHTRCPNRALPDSVYCSTHRLEAWARITLGRKVSKS